MGTAPRPAVRILSDRPSLQYFTKYYHSRIDAIDSTGDNFIVSRTLPIKVPYLGENSNSTRGRSAECCNSHDLAKEKCIYD